MSRRPGTLAIVAAGVLLLPAAVTLLSSGLCSLVDLYDGAGDAGGGGRSTSATGSGGHDAGSDALPPCPDAMVAISAVTATGLGYCIDRLEVTNFDYARFLDRADAGEAPDAGGPCKWNTSYDPAVAVDAGDDLPVLGVDWCDAWAYCLWAKKRLCGQVGGGAVSQNLINMSESQWYRACSHNDGKKYPYNDTTFDIAACADCDVDAGCSEDAGGVPDIGPAPVGSKAGCAGGYAGLFDMSGNAAEWEDGCDDKSGFRPDASDDAGHPIPDARYDTCFHRGGSFYMTGSAEGEACLACSTAGTGTSCTLAGEARSHRPPDVGLRCCLDY